MGPPGNSLFYLFWGKKEIHLLYYYYTHTQTIKEERGEKSRCKCDFLTLNLLKTFAPFTLRPSFIRSPEKSSFSGKAEMVSPVSQLMGFPTCLLLLLRRPASYHFCPLGGSMIPNTELSFFPKLYKSHNQNSWIIWGVWRSWSGSKGKEESVRIAMCTREKPYIAHRIQYLSNHTHGQENTPWIFVPKSHYFLPDSCYCVPDSSRWPYCLGAQ